MRRYDLEERLIEFAASVIRLSEQLPKIGPGAVLSNQLARSGTSPALNYGEAQAAESRRDFIHKMKIGLKELRETLVCLQILKRTHFAKSNTTTDAILKENNELIAIFVKSIETAKSNMQ